MVKHQIYKTSSEEEKEKMLSDEKNSDTGDDKKTDSSDEDAMDLDPNVTPRNPPASKRQASAAPITTLTTISRLPLPSLMMSTTCKAPLVPWVDSQGARGMG